MDKKRWDKVNEVMKAWAEKKEITFYGDILNGKLTGYLSMELGRIREVFGSAFVIMFDGKARRSSYEYMDLFKECTEEIYIDCLVVVGWLWI